MKKIISILSCGLIFSFTSLYAEVIKVGLEPFPPLITEEGKGFSVKMLRAMEKISDIRFKIKIMPYNRAKVELKKGIKNLIGHTPYQLETKEFYVYAQELNWSINAPLDIYSMDKGNLHPDKFKTLKKIGTPRGNEGFFSEVYGIPIEQFYSSGDIGSLLKMMKKGRIDIFLFERASTMTKIQEIGIKNVFYRNIDIIPASFGVRKDKQGTELKRKLDVLIKKVDQQQIFYEHLKYSNLPKSGIVYVP